MVHLCKICYILKYPSFETERLYLNAASIEDASFYLTLLNGASWIKYIGDRNVHDESEARQYIENRMLPQFDKLGFGNYTLKRKKDEVKIGSCGIYKREGFDHPDIGFALLEEYEGQGYAFESSVCLLEAAFKLFKLEEIHAFTTYDNQSSQRLLKNLGLKKSGKVKWDNEDELLQYKITKLEFRAK